jgi:nucleoside diphosphate kinase
VTMHLPLCLSMQAEHAEKDFFETLTTFMTSGPVVKLELERNNAIKAWRSLLGPTNPSVAKEQAPASIRAQFGNSEDPAVSTQVTMQPFRMHADVQPSIHCSPETAIPCAGLTMHCRLLTGLCCLVWSRMLRTVVTAQSLLRVRLRSCSAPLRSRLRRRNR